GHGSLGDEQPAPSVRHREGRARGVRLTRSIGSGQPAPGSRYRPRSFGSSASRNESPNRLKPKTPRLIGMPGNSPTQGAFSAYDGAEPESIRPHDGVGSAVPRPR